MPALYNYSQTLTHSEHGANIKSQLLETHGTDDSLVAGIEGLPNAKLGQADLKLRTEFRKARRPDLPTIIDIVREVRPSLARQLEATIV